MNYTKTEAYESFAEFLFRKWNDGTAEPHDQFRDDEGRYQYARFGRRVLVDTEGQSLEYERFDKVEDAWRRMEFLHEYRPPVEWDAIVYQDRYGYTVSIEGKQVGTFADIDDAYVGLAQAMVDDGCFPDAFFVGERGDYHRIDAAIRELHDDGGDQMRADLAGAS